MADMRVVLLHNAGHFANPCLARRLAAGGQALVLHAPRAGMVEELRALGAAVSVIDDGELAPGWDGTAEGWNALVALATAPFGRLDAATLLPPMGHYGRSIRGRLLEAPAEHVAAMGGYLDVTAHALRAVIPALRQRGGQVLVLTSDAGARPEAGWSLYGAARAGQNFLIRAAALEHAGEGVQINALGSKNAISQGFPYAPPGAASDTAVTPGDWAAPLLAETPLPWLGTMDGLAAFAISLVDGSNRFQTAQYFSYSGGWSEM
ncbi:MAG: SDR family oxidoreductase [Sphingomonadales bacterium]|nr:SDR family oxidoreductase [Sphingomonadales bacterium]